MSTDQEVHPLALGADEEVVSDQSTEAVENIAFASARALRRALSFLERQRSVLSGSDPHTAEEEPSTPLSEGPCVVSELGDKHGAWASLQLDSAAILALMDGLFTPPPEDEEEDEDEDEDEEQAELGEKLTLAQRALMRQVSSDLLAIIAKTVSNLVGLTFEGEGFAAFATDETYTPPDDAVVVEINVEEVPYPWSFRIFMGSKSLELACRASNGAANVAEQTHTLAECLSPVPFDVVAELGRVTMKLSELLQLHRGDIVRLSTAASDPILVRVEGVPKFKASPVISRGQAAVSIESRYTD